MCLLLSVLLLLCLFESTQIVPSTITDLLSSSCHSAETMDIIDNYMDSCDYLDLDMTDDVITSDDLNLIQLNIRGLISKQNMLIKETHNEKSSGVVHVYMLNETWITNKNSPIRG